MSVGRASVLIGAGTLVSRLTGLVRTIVLVTVLGSVASRAGDAFTVANQLPNTIYEIISYGLLTAVIVPQIVRSAAHADGGRTFISKLFTLGTVVLLVTTLVATLCAPLLVELFAPSFTPEQKALATVLAYWCLPQIFFYGLYAMVGEALNARKVYGPFTWAPIVNNVVSIIGFALIGVVFGTELSSVADWTPEMIAALGATATGGIVVQAGVLLLFWRRTGLHLRPDFRWRGVGLGDIGRLAGWTFAMVVVRTLAGVVQTRVVTEASGDGASAFAMANADAPSPEASVTTRVCTSPASVRTTTIAKVQPARRPMSPSPTPRQRKSGRRCRPVRRQNSSSTPACTTIPPVAVAPSAAIMPGVQSATLVRSVPKKTPMSTKPMIETTLFTIGAHVNGP